MTIATWEDRFETGIPLIDDQHRALFGAINALGESFKAGYASDQVKESLDFLAHYTLEHFDSEERHMREMGYPNLQEHIQEHTQMLARVQDLQVRQEGGFMVTADVALFFADWLAHHINEVDMGYVAFARESGESSSQG